MDPSCLPALEVPAMRKMVFGFCALVVSLMLVQGTGPNVSAQAKKKVAAKGVIEVAEGKDGKYRFFVRDGEGKLLAMSSPGGFATTKEANEAIDTLKEVISSAKVTNVKKDEKDAKKETKDKGKGS
jgi:hypothetical protein